MKGMRSIIVGWAGGWLPVAIMAVFPAAAQDGRQGSGAGDWLGVASCAAATCHGGVAPRDPVWNHSLDIWLRSDPHSAAGKLLRRKVSSQSAAIVIALDPAAAESGVAYDNVLRERCISCHGTVSPADTKPIGRLNPAVLANGVSCEACHGSAQSWLDAHVQVSWPDRKSNRETDGMRDTTTIVGRAKTCVRCHVGSRTEDGMVRDVNHDLIAAGHPALRFDLLIYHENMPSHWSQESESARYFDASAIRVRETGRAVNLAAAATLSAERAGGHLNDPSIPWPELADYDCFACHQALATHHFEIPLKDRQQWNSRISEGLPIWNAWHSIGQLELRNRGAVLLALSPHRSDPSKLAQAGTRLAIEFDNKASDTANAQPPDPLARFRHFRERMADSPPDRWHESAVAYLQLDAIVRDLSIRPGHAETAKRLAAGAAKWERMLRFDGGQTSPAGQLPGIRLESPASFDPERLNTVIQRLLNVSGHSFSSPETSVSLPSSTASQP